MPALTYVGPAVALLESPFLDHSSFESPHIVDVIPYSPQHECYGFARGGNPSAPDDPDHSLQLGVFGSLSKVPLSELFEVRIFANTYSEISYSQITSSGQVIAAAHDDPYLIGSS